MCCPYFHPVQPLTSGRILPLGDAYSGVCRAEPDSFEPDRQTLMDCCNLGYARDKCARFPRAGDSDAVRFGISETSDSIIRLRFAMEREHLPFQHGVLQYRILERAFAGPVTSELLRRQAKAYIDSYLRRKEPFTRQ